MKKSIWLVPIIGTKVDELAFHRFEYQVDFIKEVQDKVKIDERYLKAILAKPRARVHRLYLEAFATVLKVEASDLEAPEQEGGVGTFDPKEENDHRGYAAMYQDYQDTAKASVYLLGNNIRLAFQMLTPEVMKYQYALLFETYPEAIRRRLRDFYTPLIKLNEKRLNGHGQQVACYLLKENLIGFIRQAFFGIPRARRQALAQSWSRCLKRRASQGLSIHIVDRCRMSPKTLEYLEIGMAAQRIGGQVVVHQYHDHVLMFFESVLEKERFQEAERDMAEVWRAESREPHDLLLECWDEAIPKVQH